MTGKETWFYAAVSGVGTFLSAWLGGWDTPLKILVYLMVFDYLTGIVAAWRNKELNSEIMFWGGIRKAAMVIVIGLAVLVDDAMSNGAPVFRTLAIYFYVGREGLSTIENLGKFGVWLPPALKDALEQLQKKGGKEKDDGNSNGPVDK